jgi:hypothetical protein
MAKIKVSDLHPINEEQFIHALTLLEMQSVKAGRRESATTEETDDTVAEAEQQSTMDQINETMILWGDMLDNQIKNMRKQLGI